MKSKKYYSFVKVSIVTAVTFILMILGYVACQENDADEKPFNTNSTSNLAPAGKSGSTVNSSIFHEGVGAPVSLEVANRWKAAYKKEHIGAPESHFFGSAIFHRLLSQPNVAGITIEYALNDNGVPQLLLVAVDKSGNKLTTDSDGGEDASRVCPPDCPK